jgi:hypothetical protein
MIALRAVPPPQRKKESKDKRRKTADDYSTTEITISIIYGAKHK